MTVAEWIKKNKKRYLYAELSIVEPDGSIILDDRIAYLDSRSKDYNKAWRAKCRGRQIAEVKSGLKGIILVMD